MSFKSLAGQALRRSGALHAIRFRQRRRLRILMYHRFPGSAGDVRQRLSWQCAHLRRYFQPVSMADVARASKAGDPMPPNSLAITVDDGYRDFALSAPVFRSYGFHPALFVVTGFVNGETWLWPDRVKCLFARSPLTRFEFDDRLKFDLLNMEARMRAGQTLSEALVPLPDAARLRVLDELPRRLEADLPAQIPPEFAPLAWEELRTLSREGVEIGAHTETHPLLSRIESGERVRAEIEGSKKRIETVLDIPAIHFCYPNGTRDDYDGRSIEAVRQAGFETAVTTEPGLNDAGADRFQLSRIGVDPGFPPAYFERCVAFGR